MSSKTDRPPRILLGVSGGIAAYKAAALVRELIKREAEVKVVLTRSAEEFVTATTLATLSGNTVWRTEFQEDPQPDIGHIELTRWADAMVVAPATANIIAKCARGVGDDLLSTVYLAFDGPVVVAPAMNPRMWDHVETRSNVERLASRGAVVVEPGEGYMACGDEGAGRLADLERIADEALLAASRSTELSGLKVVVTAGPTYEPIDPVRFVGNRSSGKMGYAIAAAARARGAEVALISGPSSLSPPWGVQRTMVETALKMREATVAAAQGANIIVMSAAIADHRPKDRRENKISNKREDWTLELEPNPDVLTELVKSREDGQLIVGFAAETEDVVERGRAKRERKGCDMIVINDVSRSDAGFSVDDNAVTVIDRHGHAETWSLMPKRQVAEKLLDLIRQQLPVTSG